VFDRFTEQSRRVVVLAQQEAGGLNQPLIGTEHILLGLARVGDGVAAEALAATGASLDAIREQVVALDGVGEQASPSHIPFSPRVRVVLMLALRVSLELDHNYIGTEHMLLALIREGKGVAIQALTHMGIDPDNVRRLVLDIISADPESSPDTFEIFSARSRRVLDLAREEAARFNHPRIGTEHILLGLACEGEGAAAEVLAAAGVSVDAIRGQVVALDGVGKQASPTPMPRSPRAKAALQLAVDMSLQHGLNRVDTEHILLALFHEKDNDAIQILSHMGIDPDNIRRLVLDIISGNPEPEAAST
jgi:ATP-dependent Clp protease ATP-binding subunit ClpA